MCACAHAGGTVAGFFTGGLNYQIEHHLFPRICSTHYPTIQPIVRRIARKHGVRYTSYGYIWENARSTVRACFV
jgi:fatty acid desaturase